MWDVIITGIFYFKKLLSEKLSYSVSHIYFSGTMLHIELAAWLTDASEAIYEKRFSKDTFTGFICEAT